MAPRDAWHRRRLYDGDPYWQTFIEWTIAAVRILAVPTVGAALLLALDAFLPGPATNGMPYTQSVDAHFVQADGIALKVVRLGRPECIEQRGGRTLLFADRPNCSSTVSVGAEFGRQVTGGDTLRVIRTPIFGWVSEVCRPRDGLRERSAPLQSIGAYVLWGFVPLLSFGKGFAHSPLPTSTDRRLMVYVVPALLSEATYAALLVQAFT